MKSTDMLIQDMQNAITAIESDYVASYEIFIEDE